MSSAATTTTDDAVGAPFDVVSALKERDVSHVLKKIFRPLSLRDRARCRRVSALWKRAVDEDGTSERDRLHRRWLVGKVTSLASGDYSRQEDDDDRVYAISYTRESNQGGLLAYDKNSGRLVAQNSRPNWLEEPSDERGWDECYFNTTAIITVGELLVVARSHVWILNRKDLSPKAGGSLIKGPVRQVSPGKICTVWIDRDGSNDGREFLVVELLDLDSGKFVPHRRFDLRATLGIGPEAKVDLPRVEFLLERPVSCRSHESRGCGGWWFQMTSSVVAGNRVLWSHFFVVDVDSGQVRYETSSDTDDVLLEGKFVVAKIKNKNKRQLHFRVLNLETRKESTVAIESESEFDNSSPDVRFESSSGVLVFGAHVKSRYGQAWTETVVDTAQLAVAGTGDVVRPVATFHYECLLAITPRLFVTANSHIGKFLLVFVDSDGAKYERDVSAKFETSFGKGFPLHFVDGGDSDSSGNGNTATVYYTCANPTAFSNHFNVLKVD